MKIRIAKISASHKVDMKCRSDGALKLHLKAETSVAFKERKLSSTAVQETSDPSGANIVVGDCL